MVLITSIISRDLLSKRDYFRNEGATVKSIFQLIKTLFVSLLFVIPSASQGATIASDGGVTLWLSYDELTKSTNADGDTIYINPTGALLSAEVTEHNDGCNASNGARAAHGAPDSPGSCGTADGTCTGEDKLIGDLENFANYLYQSTDGAHYLRHVYISDQGRGWETADVRWNIGDGGSSATPGGWKSDGVMNMRNAQRRCIHDVINHEFGHYFYALADRYWKLETAGYYRGTLDGTDKFNVGVCEADTNTVMSSNFPHRFVDGTNASIAVSYNAGGTAHFDCANPDGTGGGQVLTPGLLSDGDPDNDGPRWAGYGLDHYYAQDEWSYVVDQHIDLEGVHTE